MNNNNHTKLIKNARHRRRQQNKGSNPIDSTRWTSIQRLQPAIFGIRIFFCSLSIQIPFFPSKIAYICVKSWNTRKETQKGSNSNQLKQMKQSFFIKKLKIRILWSKTTKSKIFKNFQEINFLTIYPCYWHYFWPHKKRVERFSSKSIYLEIPNFWLPIKSIWT